MNQEIWEKCVAFHGHECPGLAIGVKACEAAIEKLGLEFAKDEEMVCVTENNACGVDAVQVLTGCTMGKGNLLYRGTGKMAFNFFNRKTGGSLRVVLKPFTADMDRMARKDDLLASPVEEIFEFSTPRMDVPEVARLFQSVVCEVCGESAPEHKIRIQEGKRVCLDCFEEYTRGW